MNYLWTPPNHLIGDITIMAILILTTTSHAESTPDPLAPWRSGVQVRSVSLETECHTIHSYFTTCPESPDGRLVLFFASTARDSQAGEVRIRNRETGEEKVLAQDVHVEDAHRVAVQQWASKGRRVVFNGEKNGEWGVTVVDVDSGQASDMAKGRILGFTQPNADLVPIYGPHWNPGLYHDLELLNVKTGEIRTALTADAVKTAYPEWMKQAFGDKPTSIFAAHLSPDLTRVFFKMATANDGDPRSPEASKRLGLVCYHLGESRFLYNSEQWAHPCWHPDSRTIVEAKYTFIDSDNGSSRCLADLPRPMGDHPSPSPDSKLIVIDAIMDRIGKEWVVVVADARGTDQVIIHQFDNSGGATSWRRSHPHPVFSADGKRIYFNVSNGNWTRLYVAEAAR